MRKALITGASGTVGSGIVRSFLSSEKWQVHAISRRPLIDHDRLIHHAIDLSTTGWEHDFASLEFDTIVHAAQPVGPEPWKTAAGDWFDLHVLRTLNHLAPPQHCNCIYISGVWLYGHQAVGRQISESSPWRPFGSATSRVAVHTYLREACPRPWTALVLPSLVYGRTGTLPILARQIRAGRAPVLDRDDLFWSLIEQDDAGNLVRLLAERPLAEPVLMAAEPMALPIRDVHAQIASCLDISYSPASLAEMQQSYPPEEFEVITSSQPVDSSLLRDRIGWAPKYRFSERLPDLLSSI